MPRSSFARARLVTRSYRTTGLLSLLVAGALAGCIAAGASAVASTGMVALNVLRKVFVGVAGANYGDPYKEDADKLFQVMAKPVADKVGDAANPAGAAAGAAGGPGAPATGPGAAPAPGGGTGPGTGPGAPATPAGPTAAGTTAAAAPVAYTGPLALEVGLWKEEIIDGRSIATPVQDGEVLYDKYGTHGLGDNIKFMFRTNADAYVYVISIDGTGWIRPMFPSIYAGFTNPVQGGKTFTFPEGNEWAPLDSYRGVEHLYFLVSRGPRPDLEKTLAVFATKTRDVDPNRQGSEPVLVAQAQTQGPAQVQVQEAAPIARGFEAPRKSMVPEVATSSGEKLPVDAQIFAGNGTGDLVVTRWIRHQ